MQVQSEEKRHIAGFLQLKIDIHCTCTKLQTRSHKLTFEEFLIHTSPWILIKIIIFWCTWLRNLWRRRTVYQSCGIFYMQQWLVQIQCLFMWSQSLDLHACCKSIYFYAIPYTQIHKCSYSKNKNERFIVSQC